jgi:hypothetical protein
MPYDLWGRGIIVIALAGIGFQNFPQKSCQRSTKDEEIAVKKRRK